MGEKKYVKRDGDRRAYKRSTASVLRLIDPFVDVFPLHVRADSYFASVETAVAMLSHGCHFSGPVKQGRSKFPLAWLRAQVADGERGDAAFATTQVTDETGATHTLRAAAWKDHTVQCFVSTRGLSDPGEPAEKTYMRSNEDNVDVQVVDQVPRPRVVQETHDCLAAWYECAGAVAFSAPLTDGRRVYTCSDVHNHLRQGILGLENYVRTQCWWHRTFCTLLGMMTVNAYLTLKHRRAGQYDRTLLEFTDALALELITTLDRSADGEQAGARSHGLSRHVSVRAGQQSSAHKRSRFSDVSLLAHVAAPVAPPRADGPRACHFVSTRPPRVKERHQAAGAGGVHDGDEHHVILTPVRKRMRANDERYRDDDGNLRDDVHHQRGSADVRFKCKICKTNKTSFYCKTHSNLATKVYVWVCINRDCHFVHAQQVIAEWM